MITYDMVIFDSESSKRLNKQGPSRDTLALPKYCQCMRSSAILLSVLSLMKIDHHFGKRLESSLELIVIALQTSNKILFIQCL